MADEYTAQTNSDDIAVQSQEAVNDAEFTDGYETEPTTEVSTETATETADSSNGETQADGGETKPTQSLAERAQYAQRRRDAERAKEIENAKAEARKETLKEMLNGVNPYTEEPIEDDVDFETYQMMREIEQKGGDPVMDFAKYASQKRKEEAKAAAQAKEQDTWFANDLEAFREKHPEITDDGMNDLLRNNKQFAAFAERMVGKVTLNDIYDSYTDMMSVVETTAQSKAENIYAKKLSSPSSLGGTSEYTPAKNIADLTNAEMEELITRVKRGEKIL